MLGLGQKKSDHAFYEAFEAHAARSVEAAKLVAQMPREPARAAELSKEVHRAENAGDKITHDTIARLHKTWITPIDRSDIHSLITSLDDVLDLIEAVAELVALYAVRDLPAFVVKLAESLQVATEAVDKAIQLLPQVKKPKQM